jgi:tetratricopeptide (TPR) repeat protein
MADASASGSAGAAPIVWNIPHPRNPYFTGREELLGDLGRSLGAEAAWKRVQTLYGLAGVGKTQAAVEYAYRHREAYRIVWWVPSGEPAAIAGHFAGLAGVLGFRVARSADTEDVCRALGRFLDQCGDWLLIFDNVPAAENVRRFLPRLRTGHAIITSRNPNWQEIGPSIHVQPLKRKESVSFLLQRTGVQEAEAAQKLSQALGDLPLALEQAAACVQNTQITLGEYLSHYEGYWAELLKTHRPEREYPDSVAMTWELSLRQVEREQPMAAELMSLCAYLSPEGIELNLLQQGAPFLPAGLAGVVGNPLRVESAVGELRRYSLVDVEQRRVSFHPLVGALARDRLDDAGRKRWAESAVRMLGELFLFDSGNVQTWARCAPLLPHAMAAAMQAEAAEAAPTETAGLLNEVGRYLHKRAQFAEAEQVLLRALAIVRRVFGAEHVRMSAVANNLGRVYRSLGQWEQAHEQFTLAMKCDQAAYGSMHPHVAEVANNLATCLQVKGDAESAREHFEWALAVCEAHYGQDHPKVGSIVNNLGCVLGNLGKLDVGLDYCRRALTIAEAAQGPDHPQVASVLNNLGLLLQRLGRGRQAREALERALAIDEGIYGRRHPAVARDLCHLGDLLAAEQQYGAAVEHLKRALEIDEAVYGSEHAEVARRLAGLARVYGLAGDAEQAERCRRRSHAILGQGRRRERDRAASSC